MLTFTSSFSAALTSVALCVSPSTFMIRWSASVSTVVDPAANSAALCETLRPARSAEVYCPPSSSSLRESCGLDLSVFFFFFLFAFSLTGSAD